MYLNFSYYFLLKIYKTNLCAKILRIMFTILNCKKNEKMHAPIPSLNFFIHVKDIQIRATFFSRLLYFLYFSSFCSILLLLFFRQQPCVWVSEYLSNIQFLIYINKDTENKFLMKIKPTHFLYGYATLILLCQFICLYT